MESIDLTRHTPDVFFGKSVTLDGRTYRISASFFTGDQGYASYSANPVLKAHLGFPFRATDQNQRAVER